MSKSVVLVLELNHESEYGEYANTPVFNAHGDIIGWTGGEVPESGHSCEFNALNDEGFTSCASSTTVNKLRDENIKLRDIAHDMWRLLLATGNDDLVLSIEASGVVKEVIDAEELAKTMRELGIEVYQWVPAH